VQGSMRTRSLTAKFGAPQRDGSFSGAHVTQARRRAASVLELSYVVASNSGLWETEGDWGSNTLPAQYVPSK